MKITIILTETNYLTKTIDVTKEELDEITNNGEIMEPLWNELFTSPDDMETDFRIYDEDGKNLY